MEENFHGEKSDSMDYLINIGGLKWYNIFLEDRMSHVIEIDNNLYNTLVKSFGKEVLKDKLHTFLFSALENQLERYTGEILKFEKKYGTSFSEFEKQWDEGKIKDRHGHEVEGDFMDWEMMEMEKKELLTALSGLQWQKAG